MAKRIIWTRRAQNERKEILLYWKHRNQSSTFSKKLNERLKRAVKLITTYPNIGGKTDIENVRVKVVGNYLIFYESVEEEIYILSLWDSRRNPDEIPS